MAENNFYPKLAGALVLSLISASILTADTVYAGILSGIAALSAFFLVRHAEDTSLKHGRTDRMKVGLASTSVLYELLLFLGAASAAIIPKYAAAIVIASIGFAEILRLEVEQELRESFTADIGRQGRVIVLAVSLAAHSINTWYLFYGIFFIALLAIYDSMGLIHRLWREV